MYFLLLSGTKMSACKGGLGQERSQRLGLVRASTAGDEAN